MAPTDDHNVIRFPPDRGMRKRVNTAYSLLQQRPHHPDDDVLIRLALGALDGLTAEELVNLETELLATRKAGA